jgi:hypothetical protein
VELTTADFDMGAPRFPVASLGSPKDGGGALQVTLAVLGIKRQRAHQRVGGVADLAERDRRVFPPAAAPFGGPRISG